ncbi:MAG: hypothetical protein NVS2B2_22260 [Ktedonobacteraceae bacterium]
MTTSRDNSNVQAIRQSVTSSYNELHQLLGQLILSPANKLYETSIEGEWTFMENIAHIIEFMQYWGEEIVKLVAKPGQVFGRTQQDEARIRGIEDHKQDTLKDAQGALEQSYLHLDKVLSTLNDSDLELKGHHLKFGDQTLAWFIKDFVTDHLTNHIVQMKRCLAAL